MKYFGKDAPRDRAEGSPTEGQLIWNTDYSYSPDVGYEVQQRVQVAYPQAVAEYNNLVADNRDVSYSYTAGGYVTLNLRTRTNAIDPTTGSPIRAVDTPVTVSIRIEGSEIEIPLLEHRPTLNFMAYLVAQESGDGTNYSANDLRAIWRNMVTDWLDGVPTFKWPEDGNLVSGPLSEANIVGTFMSWTNTPSDPTLRNQVELFVDAAVKSDGVVALANYSVIRSTQVLQGYSLITDAYAGIDEYWTTEQLQAELGTLWPSVPDIVGVWLKKAATERYRSRDSYEIEERWDQVRSPHPFLYPYRS